MSNEIPLGKATDYPQNYQPQLLFPIPRQEKRDELGLSEALPFTGSDIWNGYELSWLNNKGKPQVAIGVFEFPYSSPNIVESKSFKLYLNSFNQSRFDSWSQVSAHMIQDLSEAAGEAVTVYLYTIEEYNQVFPVVTLKGQSLDGLDIEVDQYDYQANLLKVISSKAVEETLNSDLLKSNCLITNQPDWASIQIEYKGQQIDKESLLRYLISFRTHNEFHEQCVERIFIDIMRHCEPQELTVYARYTRRGGLDINPIRTNAANPSSENSRLSRQ